MPLASKTIPIFSIRVYLVLKGYCGLINREHGGAEYVFWDTYGALTLSARKTHENILSASGTDCVAAGTFPCVVSISSASLAANTTASAVAVAAGKANHVVAAPLQESLPSFSMQLRGRSKSISFVPPYTTSTITLTLSTPTFPVHT